MNKRISIVAVNGVWQLLPAVSGLIISILMVSQFSDSIWGKVVPYIVWQQVITALLAWGNKDYLQQQFSLNPPTIRSVFTSFFLQRAVFLVLGCILLFVSGWIDHPEWLITMIVGRFFQQSFDFWLLQSRRFLPVLCFDLLVLILQLLWIQKASGFEAIMMAISIGFLAKGLFVFILHLNRFSKEIDFTFRLIQPLYYALINLMGLVATRIDLIILIDVIGVSDAYVGRYQLIMALLWNIRSMAAYVISPYIPHFYRMGREAKAKASMTLLKFGFVTVPLGVAAMQAVLYYAYGFEFDKFLILLSLIFGILPFIMSPQIHKLYQAQRMSTVLLLLVLTVVISAACMMMFQSFVIENVLHSLLILTLIRVFMTLIYVAEGRKSERIMAT